MSRTYKDGYDFETLSRISHHAGKQYRRTERGHMAQVLRFSMDRYIKANVRHDVDRSAKWFAAVDRSSRILGALD